MHRKLLYASWIFLFTLCACLGLLEEPEGALRVLMTLLSLLFFVPPALLLKYGTAQDRHTVFYLALASLLLTVLILCLSIIFAAGSAALGTFFHVLLTIVSAPMICSGRWVISLFCWAAVMLCAKKPAKS